MRIGVPRALKDFSTFKVVASSNALVLSSSNKTSGFKQTAMAKEIRCACPPESVFQG